MTASLKGEGWRRGAVLLGGLARAGLWIAQRGGGGRFGASRIRTGGHHPVRPIALLVSQRSLSHLQPAPDGLGLSVLTPACLSGAGGEAAEVPLTTFAGRTCLSRLAGLSLHKPADRHIASK